MDIDFVITWVDMNDPAWQADFNRYAHRKGNSSNGTSPARFRDHGLLRYWFRGVETFAPWVRKIHFVTCGQQPSWLATHHPKLHLVRHADIIPQQFLPTYNSGVIERYLHRIPGLAEHFVYFNDDFFIVRPVPQERFFREGLPCDIAATTYNPSWALWYKMLKNNIRLINQHFTVGEVLARDKSKWFDKSYGSKARWNHLLPYYNKFLTLRTPHNAQPYLRATYDEVWAAAAQELTSTSANRFRAATDYTHELFRTWQICRGHFMPYNTYADTRMFPLLVRAKQAVRAIRQQDYALVCLNDNAHIRHYDRVLTAIEEAFRLILPATSTFEQ